MNTVFTEAPPDANKPTGHLKEFLDVQLEGLSGNYKAHGWPFDSAMWNGGAGPAVSPGVVYKFPPVPKPADPQFEWWPYETCSYLLTGLMKIAVLSGRKDLENLCKENLDYVFSHPDSRGVLGHATDPSPSEWPFSPFFGIVKTWYEWKKDPSIPEKLKKHFLATGSDIYASDFRNINNLEGILNVYFWSGDHELLELAEESYNKHNQINAVYKNSDELWFDRIDSEENYSMHGVSYAESLKLPVLLYMATGKKKYLTAAEKSLKIITQRHGDISGMITCDEFLAGRDPLQGYETCVIAALGWTLGYFLMTSGKGCYADRMEKIFYNAFFGTVTKDFTGLSYFSSPNQVIMAPEAQHGYGMRGSSAQRRYAADHEPHCCSGSVHRILPEFVMRMWMTKKNGSPAAVCYGPSRFTGSYQKCGYTIEEKTEYPYSEKIDFVFSVDKTLKMPFIFRIPEWCKSPSLALNGKKISLPVVKDGFAEIQRSWKNGDTLTLSIPMEPVCKTDRYWTWFEAGPIVFSLPVKEDIKRDGKGKFAPYIIYPSGDWNYAVANHNNIRLIRKKTVSAPWKNPPLELEITGQKIKGFDTLELDRFTPRIPVLTTAAGKPETLKLVPYGSTLLRLTAFPDGVKRKLCPVYGVWVSEPFPCNENIPLEKQVFWPDQVPFLTFRDKATMIPPTINEYYDLREQICHQDNVVAYAAVMFYSECSGDAMIALGASSGAVCTLNGKYIGVQEPFNDAELMAPECFPVKVKKGYNHLLLKIPKFKKPLQFRNLWGFKVSVYLENKGNNSKDMQK